LALVDLWRHRVLHQDAVDGVVVGQFLDELDRVLGAAGTFGQVMALGVQTSGAAAVGLHPHVRV
jgi:hypothetical protein